MATIPTTTIISTRVKPRVRMAGDESTPPLARMKISYYPALNPAESNKSGAVSGRRGHRRHFHRLRGPRSRRPHHRDEILFHPTRFRRGHARRDARGGRPARPLVRTVLQPGPGAHPRNTGRTEPPDPT